MPRRRLSPIDVVYGLLQRFAAYSLVAFGFIGPGILGWLGIQLLPSLDQVQLPSEITAEYMVNMSLSPFPDPDVEVLDTTERLMDPSTDTSKEVDENDGESQEKAKGADEKLFDEPVDTKAPPRPVPEAGDNGEAETSRSGELAPEVRGTSKDGVQARGGVGKDGILGPADQQGVNANRAQKCLPENPRIKHIEGDKYRVDRDLVDYYVNHLNEAGKLAVLTWEDNAQGEHIGFRIWRIRCGNDLHQLGFRNKDVVLAINGETVESVPQAIAAYRRLRKENILRVRIRRRGNERVLVFRLKE